MNLTLRQRTDRPDKKGECRIFLDVTWAGQRLSLPTGVKCLPEYWKEGKKMPVHTRDLLSVRKNADLSKVVRAVTDVFDLAREAVTADDLKHAAAQAAGKARKLGRGEAAAPAPTTIAEFYALWQAENPSQTFHSARRYKQVVAHLHAYHAGLRLEQINRRWFLDYLDHLASLQLVDSTVAKHVKFLRECHRLAGQPMPVWLKIKTKYGRAPALQRDELRALMALETEEADLAQERDLFVFQTLLLLRDSDLRALKPHHVAPVDLPGYRATPVLTFYQAKTGDEVRLPLPPAAARLWQQWQGQPPVPSQQERNRRMKQLARVARLERPFVRVQYVRGEASEEVVPLHRVITTHTARHTGADMVMLGSGGNSDLKEKALGHAGVYGHDALERYGPALLQAWAHVLATFEKAHNPSGKARQVMASPPPLNGFVRVVSYHNSVPDAE